MERDRETQEHRDTHTHRDRRPPWSPRRKVLSTNTVYYKVRARTQLNIPTTAPYPHTQYREPGI